MADDVVADSPPAPLWRLPRDLFRFTTTDRAELHTAVMQVFGDANERLCTALTFDEVRDGLAGVGWHDPVGDEELDRTLRALTDWRLLEVTQDHTRRYAYVLDRTGTIPWAMTARDYVSVVQRGGPPVGRVTDAPWDARLAPALRARGAAVPQEDVCPRLLDAMAAADPTAH